MHIVSPEGSRSASLSGQDGKGHTQCSKILPKMIVNISASNKIGMAKVEARALAYCPADHCNTFTSLIQMSANTEVLFTKHDDCHTVNDNLYFAKI